ncbi:DUF1893 domain-containing protein [Fusobacterium sp.]|uniref:DUF1893 domain-containing protein n=1 Tax=Fusobacterium sp. TaxID=68766 RepID=UPI00262450E4|nr:DUF1893 domain-containing protein [Fusobacterium sp.]
MNDNNLKTIVDAKEELIIVLNSNNEIIFKTNESPLSSFLKKIFIEELKEQKLKVYANQVGIGLVELNKILNIEFYYGTKISIPAKKLLDESNIKYEYKEIIDLVKSSNNSEKVCPIEEKLNSLETFNERLDFLKKRAFEKKKACSITLNRK